MFIGWSLICVLTGTALGSFACRMIDERRKYKPFDISRRAIAERALYKMRYKKYGAPE
jgi:hypothetical protein